MAASLTENQLGISWRDSAWVPVLNAENVLHYFCQRSNPFYDRTCNNEVVKMQRLDPAQMKHMVGIEYELIHCQDPILYVVRKQHRHGPAEVTFLAVYYILAGTVYQAPDLGSVLNSRILSTVYNVQQTFNEALSYSRYNPSKGYYWKFPDSNTNDKKSTNKKEDKEGSSMFQRQRIDVLLGDFLNKFPPHAIQDQSIKKENGVDSQSVKNEKNAEVKEEPTTSSTINDTTTNKTQTQNTSTTTTTKTTTTTTPSQSYEMTNESAVIGTNKIRHGALTSTTKPSTPPIKKRKL